MVRNRTGVSSRWPGAFPGSAGQRALWVRGLWVRGLLQQAAPRAGHPSGSGPPAPGLSTPELPGVGRCPSVRTGCFAPWSVGCTDAFLTF